MTKLSDAYLRDLTLRANRPDLAEGLIYARDHQRFRFKVFSFLLTINAALLGEKARARGFRYCPKAMDPMKHINDAYIEAVRHRPVAAHTGSLDEPVQPLDEPFKPLTAASVALP